MISSAERIEVTSTAISGSSQTISTSGTAIRYRVRFSGVHFAIGVGNMAQRPPSRSWRIMRVRK